MGQNTGKMPYLVKNLKHYKNSSKTTVWQCDVSGCMIVCRDDSQMGEKIVWIGFNRS